MQQQQAAHDSLDIYRYALSHAIDQSGKGEYADALPALESIIAAPEFIQLNSAQQHAALMIAGLVALELDKPAVAAGYLARSTAMPEASEHDWQGRFRAAFSLDDTTTAVTALTRIARRWPAQLSEFGDQIILGVARKALHHATPEAQFDMLEALFDARWKNHADTEPDNLWRELALMNLERNRVTRATEIARRITGTRILLSMRIDRRFDTLRAQTPAQFDIVAAADNEIARWRTRSEAAPRSLDTIVQLTYAQLDAGRFDEVLRTTDAVMKTVARSDAAPPPYDDFDDSYIWIIDNHANALQAMSRWDEAEREICDAANRKENGHPNVSNVINLAWFYARQGRADDSLATLGDTGEGLSSYGMMQFHSVRHAAAVQKGDGQIAEESLEYLRKHRTDAISTWQHALVRANRLDEAEDTLILRLRDPRRRSDALTEVQEYTEPPLASMQKLWYERWQEVISRSAIRKVIDEVGRIETFTIPSEIG